MRKTLSLAVAVGLVAAIANPQAHAARKRPKPRIVEQEYTATQGFQIGYESTPAAYVGKCDDPDTEPGCVRIRMRRGETSLTIEVRDLSGQPVNAYVWDANGGELATVCGSSKKRIRAAGFVDVWPTGGTCWEEPTPSVPTTGTVVATIYRG